MIFIYLLCSVLVFLSNTSSVCFSYLLLGIIFGGNSIHAAQMETINNQFHPDIPHVKHVPIKPEQRKRRPQVF